MNGFLSKLFWFLRRRTLEIPPHDLKSGALYSVYNGDESQDFGVVKILVLESPAVHICVYRDKFPTRPEQVEPEGLRIGLTEEEFKKALAENTFGDMGIAHMPLDLRDFIYGWQPVYLSDFAVTEDELGFYQDWKDANGGIFSS